MSNIKVEGYSCFIEDKTNTYKIYMNEMSRDNKRGVLKIK